MRELNPKWVSDLPIATEFNHEQSLLRGEKPAGWDLMCLEPRLVAEKRRKASRGLWKVGWRIMLEKVSRASVFLCI